MSLGRCHRITCAASRLGVRRAAAAAESPSAPPFTRGLASGSTGEVQAILIEGVEGLGSAREVVAVRAGYLRNCLYPTKKAVYATRANLQRYGLLREEPPSSAQEQQQTEAKASATGEADDASVISQHLIAEKILTRLSQSTLRIVRDIVRLEGSTKAPEGKEVHATADRGSYYMRSQISAEHVAEKVQKQLHIVLHPHAVKGAESIGSLGEHVVQVECPPFSPVPLKVNVVKR